jgi:hypothetical protein
MNFTFLAGVIIAVNLEAKYKFRADAMLFILVSYLLELASLQ